MSKNNINKLNKIISKIISLLEEDITEIDSEEIKNRKDISSILSRLASSTIQLNKLESDDEISSEALGKKDLEILDDFLGKYRK